MNKQTNKQSEGGAAIAPCKGSDTSPTHSRMEMKMRMVIVMMVQWVVIIKIIVKKLIIRIRIPEMTMLWFWKMMKRHCVQKHNKLPCPEKMIALS